VICLVTLPSPKQREVKQKQNKIGLAPVVLACNPSYSGGRDQEDCSSTPAKKIVKETISKKYLTWLAEWLKW
jgi:hypothetical protein